MDLSRLRRLALGLAIAIWRERVYELAHDDTLTQRRLQSEAKLPKGSVSRLERGVTEPTPEELRRIAEALGTQVSNLLRAAELLFELLQQALGPLRLVDDHSGELPPASEVADREIPLEVPEELRLRWERLIAAEAELARERYRLLHETAVHASRLGIALGPPRPIT